MCGTVERELTYSGKAADKTGKREYGIILLIRGRDVSEQGALLTAGGAVPGAGVPAGAQTMTFVGLKEMQKKKKPTKYLSFCTNLLLFYIRQRGLYNLNCLFQESVTRKIQC